MKKIISPYFAILLFLTLWVSGCKKNVPEIQLTIGQNKIEFHNWKLSQSTMGSNQAVSLSVWDDEKQEVLETEVPGELSMNKNQEIVFRPSFPLEENTRYLLRVNTRDTEFEQLISIPRKEYKRPFVSKIYPSSDTLPENLLRIYIYFSQPMKTKGAIEYIKLFDENENEITRAIFSNVFELWDTNQKRLTVLFDPARVKTGLRANLKNGRALKAGHNYRIVVEKAEDIHGQIIDRPFTKSFYVNHEDLTMPNLEKWKIKAPKFNSLETLSISFPDILDHSSLAERINIIDPEGQPVAGRIKTVNCEKEWLLTPTHKWVKGKYTLQVNSRLEDPAGNNLNGLFDHKIGSLKSEKEGEIISVNFKIL